MAFGGFYKGEKKKTKKGKEGKAVFSNAATFTLPEIISKKKKTC
ncbi:MAG: hypothetical protein Q7R53_02700 [bacterium]|nr:hypothetical protein [bacterium]